MKGRSINLERHLFLTILVAVVITGALTITSLTRSNSFNVTSILCTFAGNDDAGGDPTPNHLNAILHYATTRVIPQQTLPEIRVTFDLLRSISPCNLLVFGLGQDSMMWSTFNHRGTTVFLEEDIKWVHRTLSQAPSLRVHPIQYGTRLSDADEMLNSYKSVKYCLPSDVYLRGNTRCKLALHDLPNEVYNREWDVILIDGPRGYFDDAPGRMSAIFTAAVMARGRVRSGATHVVLHDVNRRVEKAYAQEFLCMKHLVKAEGRIWHFQIPTAPKFNIIGDNDHFC